MMIVIAFVWLLSGSRQAASAYECPANLSATWSVPAVPSGWQTSAGNNQVRHTLSAVTFSLGHPSERAFLRPSDRKETGPGKVQEIYELSGLTGHEGWLVCMYLNTPAIVYKPLAKRHQRCDVSYANKAVSAIECQ